MRTSVIAGTLLAGLAITAFPVHAQQFAADVVVRSGPVAGHIVIGDDHSVYRRPPARRVIVVERYAPRVVVVERVHHHRRAKQWIRRGYRPVTLYYVDGRYYERRPERRRGVYGVIVWERGGRYVHDCDADRHERRRHHYRGRGDWNDD
jgi:hypothetical protein